MKLKTLTVALCFVAGLSLPVCAQSGDPSEIEKLKAKLAEQQKQLETLKQSIADQQKAIDSLSKTSTQTAAASAAPQPSSAPAPASAAPGFPRIGGNVASSTPMLVPDTPPLPRYAPPQPQNPPESPLQLKIGDVSIIPIGFLDATAVWRDKNAASGIGTNFASVPYANTAAGHLTEFRFSPQNSRIGWRMDVNVHGAHVIAYNENDFLGTSGANNIGVTNGAFVPRIRLFWVDVRKGSWEVLGGQSWSMMTPNRKAISPLPGDIFYSQVFDVNYLIGLTWTRQPGFRVLYHGAGDKFTAGLSVEQPNQYIGGSSGAPTVTLPALDVGFGGSEFDNASNVLNTPNVSPDIIAKLAFDPSSKLHFEVAGIQRTFRDYVLAANQHHTAIGGGGMANINFELAKGIRVISNNYFSDGGGRYLFGTVPDVVIRADGSISPIHAHSTTDGLEMTFGKTLVYTYFGGVWTGRNAALDANGTTPIGYGYIGSPNNHNRVIDEVTFGFNQTVWKDAKWGAINYMMQYEWANRYPWYVAVNQPSSAHDNAIYFDLRYTLPGSAPPAK